MSKKSDTHCGICEVPSFERNNYFFGKEMYARDFCQEQDYFNQKRWLLNRSIVGWGVVCGLDVHWHEERRQLYVEDGLALDCCGREILVCDKPCISLPEIKRHCGEPTPGQPIKLVVCLEYHECETEPVPDPTEDSCGDQKKPRYNRIRDSYRIELRRWEELCIKERENENCYLDAIKPKEKPKRYCSTQGLHEYLCDESKGCPKCQCCECLVLAVVDVTYGDTSPKGEPEQSQSAKYEPAEPTVSVDSCKNRRLVYGNPLLYDLIECFHGDLPRIVDFGWRDRSGREIAFDDFVSLITDQYIRVEFDKPIEKDTLNSSTFFVTVFIQESSTGHWAPKRLPCKEIKYGQSDGCYTATFVPDDHWVGDELVSRHSECADGIQVEVTLRGSLIKGESGKALDGDYVGGRLPTGNGVQGGDFVDYFRVEPRDGKPGYKAKTSSAEDVEVIKDF